jgi:hypothetical protein
VSDDPYFEPTFLFLSQEGALIRECLGQGLTAIRGANLGKEGLYYQAFFNLSIGLERLMKLTILLDHMAKNNLAVPPQKIFKTTYGHDLDSLFKTVSALAPSPLTLSDLQIRILNHLSAFARITRYHNLDALAAGRIEQDPLHSWKDILLHIAETELPKKRTNEIKQRATLMAKAMSSVVFQIAHDLDKTPLSLAGSLAMGPLYASAAPLATWHVMSILQMIDKVMDTKCDQAQTTDRAIGGKARIPYMYEFFTFIYGDKTYVKRRKRWP